MTSCYTSPDDVIFQASHVQAQVQVLSGSWGRKKALGSRLEYWCTLMRETGLLRLPGGSGLVWTRERVAGAGSRSGMRAATG